MEHLHLKYVLAHELANSPENIPLALSRYEQEMKPEILKKQKAGRRVVKWLFPDNSWRLAVRNSAMRLAATSFVPYFSRSEVTLGSRTSSIHLGSNGISINSDGDINIKSTKNVVIKGAKVTQNEQNAKCPLNQTCLSSGEMNQFHENDGGK